MEAIIFKSGAITIQFNKAWVASKTLKEFMEHEKHHNLTPAQYKEVHDLAGGKVGKPRKQAEEPEPDQENKAEG